MMNTKTKTQEIPRKMALHSREDKDKYISNTNTKTEYLKDPT